MRRRFDLTDFEWSVIEPLLPNKSRGVPRVDDQRVINSILWRFRMGSPWADVPERYGPHPTCALGSVRKLRPNLQLDANSVENLEDCVETRVPILAESLVQAFSAEAGFPGDLGHATSLSNLTKGVGEVGGITCRECL